MADTRVQLEVEDYVRREWMLAQYGQPFSRERVRLSPGGVFDFDAVTADHSIVAAISTSGARTATGKNAVGKFLKVRSDIYFLLLAEASRRILVLTERDMHEKCQREKESGRIPECIEFALAEIPQELRERLQAARRKASNEVSPSH